MDKSQTGFYSEQSRENLMLKSNLNSTKHLHQMDGGIGDIKNGT